MIDMRNGTWMGQVPLVERPSLGAAPKELTDATFSQVLAAPKAVVDFYSPGCPACTAFKPTFEEVAGRNNDILFAAVNTDEAMQSAASYQIRALPTMVFFMNGREVHRTEGALDKSTFVSEMGKAFSGGGTPGAAPLAPMQAPPAAGPSVGTLALGGLGLAALLGGAYLLFKK